MTLGDKQRLFARLTIKLYQFILDSGYEFTYGDAYRDPRVHGIIGRKVGYGRAKSNHKARLAVDLNLFKDNKYLTRTSEYQLIGEHWETLHELCMWGGSGNRNDGNHFSLKHNGRW